MKTVKKEPITAFIITLKELSNKENGIVFVDTRGNKCIDYIKNIGLTLNEAKQEIAELKETELVKGPEKDRDREGVIWVFKKKIKEKDTYIKLKLETNENQRFIKCISFHEYTKKGEQNEQN